MKTQLRSVTSLVILLFISMCAQAQDVFPGKRTIDKIEYLGLTLNQNIAEKYQSKYWETYLSKFGKVKGRRALTMKKRQFPDCPALRHSSSAKSHLRKMIHRFLWRLT